MQLSDLEPKELYSIIVIPLLVCSIPAVLSIVGAIIAYRSAKKLEKFKSTEQAAQDSAKLQHELIIAPIYHNATSDKPPEEIIKMNNAIVDKNKSCLSTEFLSIYNGLNGKPLDVYIRAIQFLYDASVRFMKYDIYDKNAIKVAKRYLRKRDKKELSVKRRELRKSQMTKFSKIFLAIINEAVRVFEFIPTGISSVTDLLIGTIVDFSVISIHNAMKQISDKLRSSDDLNPEEIDNIINNNLKAKNVLESMSNQQLEDVISFREKLEREFALIPSEQIIEPPLHIIGPALDALEYTIGTEELQDMFVSLLASSFTRPQHPSFVEIIKQLSPLDAQVLKAGLVKKGDVLSFECLITNEAILFGEGLKNYVELHGIDIMDEMYLALDNMTRLGILKVDRRNDADEYTLTGYGKSFASQVGL